MVTSNKNKKKKQSTAKGLSVGASGARRVRPGKAVGRRGLSGQRAKGAVTQRGKAISGVATSASRKALKARPKGPIAPPSDNKLNAMRKRQARKGKGPAKSPLGARNLPSSKKK